DSVATQHLPNRRRRQSELTTDDQRASLGVLARRQDPPLKFRRRPSRLMLGHRRPVGQRCPTTLPESPPKPVARSPARTAGRRSSLRTLSGKDQRHEPTTRLERETHPPRRAHTLPPLLPPPPPPP